MSDVLPTAEPTPAPTAAVAEQARRVATSFSLTARLPAESLLALREELNGKLAPKAAQLSLGDLLLKAVALAIAETPDLNVRRAQGPLGRRREQVDVSLLLAKAAPVIFDVARKRPSALAEARDLAAKAVDGGAQGEGASIAFLDLGASEVDGVALGLAPSQTLAMAVGALGERAVSTNGGVRFAPVLTATATFDPRTVTPAAAAAFMAAFRRLIETPLLLLLL